MYSHLLTLEYEFQLCVKSTGKYQRFTKNLYTYYGPEMIQEFRSKFTRIIVIGESIDGCENYML